MGYSIIEILTIWLHGIKQTILYYIPLIKPDRENTWSPTWFIRVFPDWLWGMYLDSDRRPTETWLYNYNYAAQRLFKDWFDQLKSEAIAGAITTVWGWVGGPQNGYTTISSWIQSIWARVGDWIPTWANNLASGLNDLYYKLPYDVRHNIKSWYQTFEDIRQSVKDWVKTNYDYALVNINILWAWVFGPGSVLKAWYDGVGSWISNFKLNPSTVILGALGATWQRLVQFDNAALSFYYNLWGFYRENISDFLSNPVEFIYDRAEDYLNQKW